MPLKVLPGFCAGSYAARSRGANYQRTVNMRVEKNEDPNGKGPLTLYPRSGKNLFAQVGAANGRGVWANSYRVFAANGNQIFEVMQDGTSTLIGVVELGTNPVIMRLNGTQLLVCSAGNVYIATGTGFFQPIINYTYGDASITGTTVTWLDGNAGQQFEGSGFTISPGDVFMVINGGVGTPYTVASVTDATHLELTEPVPAPLVDVEYQIGDSSIPGGPFVKGATCEFIDGYFIVGVPNSKQFRLSALEDGTNWAELDQATKSGSTDNIACVMALNGQLCLVGDTNSAEIWADSGNANFPFQRVSGTTMTMGAYSGWSVAQMPDGSLIWLMRTQQGFDQIVQTTGGNPVRISNHALENKIRKYATTDDAIGSSYSENGHNYFRITFPSANRAWECDLTDGFWIELGAAAPSDESDDFLADVDYFHCAVTWPNGIRMLIGQDGTNGNIYQISPEYTKDQLGPTRFVDFPVMRIGPHINTNLDRNTLATFALDAELGTIAPGAVGADGEPLIPMVNLYFSKDGGRTWQPQGAASLGRVGEYEGTFLTEAEMTDENPSSQTNPQAFETWPVWKALGAFKFAGTMKIRSVGSQLRAVYNGLVEYTK